MATRNALPFEYQMRGQQMQYLDDDALAHAVDQRDRDLEDFLGGGSWLALPFAANWRAYPGWQSPQYRRVGEMVQLRGLCQQLAGSTTLVGTLPAGFRPSSGLIFVVMSGEPSTPGRVDITSSGTLNFSPGAVLGLNQWVSISGIQFSMAAT